MAKSTTVYWNALAPENSGKWSPVSGLEGMADELIPSIDEAAAEVTGLTRFLPGADTTPFGGYGDSALNCRNAPNAPLHAIAIRHGLSGIAVLRGVPNPKNGDTIWRHVINDDIRIDYYKFSCAVVAESSALREVCQA